MDFETPHRGGRHAFIMIAVEPISKPINLANERLLASARSGDDAALEALIEMYEPRVFALARAIVRDRAAAEDVTQDALLRMVQKLPESTVSADTFEVWLLTLARNIAISLLRKAKVRMHVREIDDAEHESIAVRNAHSPAASAIVQEDSVRLAAALKWLKPSVREIVILRYYHDLEPAQIASIVSDSSVNVRVRISRAISELRAILAEEEHQNER
jgi:RNA polymerase sigma-70 factor (ECF subfamily)